VSDTDKFICVETGSGIGVKIIRTKFEKVENEGSKHLKPTSVNFVDADSVPFDELVDIIESQSPSSIARDIELYLRCKVNDSVIDVLTKYEAVGKHNWGHIFANLIKLDSKTIGYLQALTHTPILFIHVLENKLPYDRTKRSPRKKLLMSPNKTMVFKRVPTAFVLNCPNTIFDGDVEYLIKYVDITEADISDIIKIKIANPRLTYKNIITKLCKNVLNVNECSQGYTIRDMAYRAKMFASAYDELKEQGFTHPFSINNLTWTAFFDADINPAQDLEMQLPEGWNSCKINSVRTLQYANSITKAFNSLQLKQGLERGCYYMLFFNKDHVCLGEFKDNIALKIYNSGKEYLMQ
jgi:hypothetical protein